ncbi:MULTISPECIES: hypothetical protein [Sphingobacterium]|uniref:hypothetical protein n=1 Tax=Sphingobacterium TaxID=28453 RepID=UPI00257AEA42|nr:MULTISPECIES: hypothetical protein [Sphingobacterium]
MKQQYLFVVYAVVVAIVIFILWTKLKNLKTQSISNTNRPLGNSFPTKTVTNDKLVIVEDIDDNDVEKILQEFCNSYNQESFQAIPRLTKLSNKKFAVTFPFDIDFDIYCFFINYVNYPIGFDQSFKTIGWATTNPSDSWVTKNIANKNVMLYVSESDTECDNVYLTTYDNIGYKLGFGMKKRKQLPDRPEKDFVKSPINKSELEAKTYTDFR